MKSDQFTEAIRTTLRCLLLLVAFSCCSTALLAQNSSFTGHVKDSSGAALAKALVTVHNQNTGVSATTSATGSGDYTVPYLVPGRYTISVSSTGFKTENRIDIDLQAAQVAVINFTLSVGAVSQSVTVNGNESLLDKGSATRGEDVENTRVTELPLNGRNPVMLDRLNSSVIWNGNLVWMRPFDGQVWTNLSVNGSGNYNTEIMLDGMPDQTPRPQDGGHTNGGYVAPDDAVQDFKIVTNPYDAEYGQTRGGAINMDLKSGTNQIHGDVYEYMRRTWLDADWWVSDAQKVLNPTKAYLYGTPKHKLDQYGGELDGPVVFPKIFNGHDKLFFLGQVENWNEIQPPAGGPATTGVPDPKWATGDFSGLTYGGVPVTIYNPYDTYSCTITPPKGPPLTEICRHPFPNNKIPSNMMNPTALAYLKLYPAANQQGDAGTPWQHNYFYSATTYDIYRNALAKLDWIPTDRDKLSLRYGYWERYETVFSNGVPGLGAFGEDPLGDRAHTFATEWTHTFTPNLLVDFRANVDVKAEIAGVAATGFNPTAIGWPSSLVSQLGAFSMLPGVSLAGPTGGGFASLGDTGHGNGFTTTDALNLFPSVTWIKGKHTLHAGLDLRFGQYAIVRNPSTVAQFNFDPTWTQNCWNCGAGNDYVVGNDNNTEGNAVASMLLGLGSGGKDAIGSTAFYSNRYYAPYIQDDWKVTPKLTLNLGLRYDLQPYYVERHNRANYAFDTTTINPVDALLPTHTLATGQTFVDKGGITFLGVNGNPRQVYSTNLTEIQPRVGFSYAATDRLVIRGGFGEMFQQTDAFPILNGFSSNTNYVNSPDNGLTPINWDPGTGCCYGGNLSNPFPTIVQPTGSSLGLLTNLGNGQAYLNPKFEIPNVWQFSFGVEQQFTRNDTMELSYVGNYAPNNEASQNIDHEDGAQKALCNVQMGGNHHVCDDTYGPGSTAQSNHNAILGLVPNPYYHVAAFAGTSDYSSTNIKALNFTQPMPEFGGVTEFQWNGARSWYNSLQLTLQHRWSNELTMHGTWTWSKFMDAGGWADNDYLIPSRHLDGLDRTHNVTISMVWDLPVGRGRALLGNSNRVVDALLGGWEFASMAILQSGAPMGVPGGWDYVHSAKIKPYWRTDNHNLQWWAPCYWTTNAETGAITESQEAINFGCTQPDFIQIPAYGANPNNIYTGVRQAWNILDDSNLSKNFQLYERLKLQFRLETFNTFNHPLFSGGTYNGINQFAGQIGATTGGGQSNKPRYTQLAVKLMW